MRFFITITTLLFLCVGSFAVRAQIISDEQVLDEMKTYLGQLNGGPVTVFHSDQQLQFLKKVFPMWKISEFRELRMMPIESLIERERISPQPYFLCALAFHDEDIRRFKDELADQDVFNRIIQFRKQLRDMSHFTLSAEYNDLPQNKMVTQIKFTPKNSALLFSAGSSLYMWDMETLDCHKLTIQEYIPMGPAMWGLAHLHISTFTISPDEHYIAIGTASGIIKIIDHSTNQEVAHLPTSDDEIEKNIDHGITSLAFSPNMKFLAVGRDAYQVYKPDVSIYNIDRDMKFDLLITKDSHHELTGLAYTSDNNYLIGHHHNGTPVWAAHNGEELPFVDKLQFRNGELLYQYKTFRLGDKSWEATVADHQRIARNEFNFLESHYMPIDNSHSFDFDPQTQLIAYSNDGHSLNVKTSESSPAVEIYHTECEIIDVVISPDASHLAAVTKCQILNEDKSETDPIYQNHVLLFSRETTPNLKLILLIDPEKFSEK